MMVGGGLAASMWPNRARADAGSPWAAVACGRSLWTAGHQRMAGSLVVDGGDEAAGIL